MIPEFLDPVLLRSFVAVAEAQSFTVAARQLGLSQSTVSQHVSRLEKQVGRLLLARDTHAVTTTTDGDVVLPFARRALQANARISQQLSSANLRGRIRFGASEDFVFSALGDVLAEFVAGHSAIDLELTVALSEQLYEKYDSGQLDLILAKRREGDKRGRIAWADRLRWIGRPDISLDPAAPVPLVVFPPPSKTRELALAALEDAGRSWRIACTSGSLSGLRAAAMAGLGVIPHAGQLVPPGLSFVDTSNLLPRLAEIEFIVMGPSKTNKAANALADVLLESLSQMRVATKGF
ncbi:LysR substrate-binding domain-containing protein [Acidocella sp.]|uniref:LysR substrate-binding domain-containing protein n=1 Tax=Acidocella sp. TaxID=50710 RepID=UPI002F3E3E7B